MSSAHVSAQIVILADSISPTVLRQPKFAWKFDNFDYIPCWLSTPDIAVIETLSRGHLRLPADFPLTVTFLSEGAFNKLYTVSVSDGVDTPGSPQYIFRVTTPVEPFYKTASEVATLSYVREHTSVPVPRVIASSSTTENELGYEWILMEKLPGVALVDVWKDMDLEAKSRESKVIAGFLRQLWRIQRPFTAIGNIYFREDIDTSNGAVRVVPMEDEKYVLGPIVTPYMFVGGRKLRVPRDLGPYPDDAEYIAALAASELEDMKLLQLPGAHSHNDFDKNLAKGSWDTIKALEELQTISPRLFPSRPCHFTLCHHDLSLDNILVDPATYEITGIVDWECVGTRPFWEDPYPSFLAGPEMEEEVEPLAPGDTNDLVVEGWENWEKTKLRPVFDRELGEAFHEPDAEDEIRREFRMHLDWARISLKKVRNWIRISLERLV